MNEYYPDLMERIIRREPNAYLAALYWDSEMFGRRSHTRRKTEGTEITKDYKAILTEMFSDMPRYFTTPNKLKVAKTYRSLFIKIGLFATDKDYQKMYEALMKGDPKLRSFRALYQIIYSRTSMMPRLNGGRWRRMGDNKLLAPLSTLEWVDRSILKPNDYNPNKVSKENLRLADTIHPHQRMDTPYRGKAGLHHH